MLINRSLSIGSFSRKNISSAITIDINPTILISYFIEADIVIKSWFSVDCKLSIHQSSNIP